MIDKETTAEMQEVLDLLAKARQKMESIVNRCYGEDEDLNDAWKETDEAVYEAFATVEDFIECHGNQ